MERGCSVDGSKPFELILQSKLLLLESGDALLIPIGIGHLTLDDVFDFLFLVGQVIDMSLYRHAGSSSFDLGAHTGWRARLSTKIKPPF
jgi:hypothetical protein